MDIDNDDEILRTLAHGQSIDYSTWPSLLERLMTRLEKIVITDFQIPKPPTQPRPSSPSLSPKRDTGIEDPFTTPQPSLESLPPICYKQLLDIQNTMNKQFPTHPPHTIQRLSELLLNPTQHHRSLPSYLHALDRVVHVTSPITSFPLPPAVPDPRVSSSVLSNGTPPSVDPLSITWSNPTTGTAPVNGGLGSDEALGGALLTPISWLNKRESSLSHTGSNGTNSGGGSPRGEVRTESTETIDGPNGPGGVETVSVSVNGISSVGSHAMMSLLSSSASSSGEQGLRAEGGVTQGELLRQEQKAGVVPASQLRIQREPEREERTGKGDENGMGEDDEMPHARGPEEIGMEDMGPQEPGKVPITGGEIDVEAAVGRRPDFTEEKEEEKGKEGEREDGESSGKAGEDADGDSNMKIETKDDDEQSTTSKRAAEDDIGSEAGEKRVKEEMDIEPQPDSEIKPDDAKEDVVREEEDTKMETDPEPEAKTEHAEENAKAEPAKAETQACVDEATTSPKDTRE